MEDRDATRTDEQTEDNEDHAPQEVAPDKLDNPGDDKDDGDDPQKSIHVGMVSRPKHQEARLPKQTGFSEIAP